MTSTLSPMSLDVIVIPFLQKLWVCFWQTVTQRKSSSGSTDAEKVLSQGEEVTGGTEGRGKERKKERGEEERLKYFRKVDRSCSSPWALSPSFGTLRLRWSSPVELQSRSPLPKCWETVLRETRSCSQSKTVWVARAEDADDGWIIYSTNEYTSSHLMHSILSAHTEYALSFPNLNATGTIFMEVSRRPEVAVVLKGIG